MQENLFFDIEVANAKANYLRYVISDSALEKGQLKSKMMDNIAILKRAVSNSKDSNKSYVINNIFDDIWNYCHRNNNMKCLLLSLTATIMFMASRKLKDGSSLSNFELYSDLNHLNKSVAELYVMNRNFFKKYHIDTNRIGHICSYWLHNKVNGD